MDDRKLQHDYLNGVQALNIFVRLVSKGKLDPKSEEGAALVQEAQKAIEFLGSCTPTLSLQKSPS